MRRYTSYWITLEPYRDRPGGRGKIELVIFDRGGFDRAVWSKSLGGRMR